MCLCPLLFGLRKQYQIKEAKCSPNTLAPKVGALRGEKDLPRYACRPPIWALQTALVAPKQGAYQRVLEQSNRGAYESLI